MNLPDYPDAEYALGQLAATPHDGQHRCTDGIYYRPGAVCPVTTHCQTITQVLASARTLPHAACHDPATVEAVAQAMCQHPDGSTTPLAELDALQRAWWISRAQFAMEATAAALDPSVAAL